MKLAGTVTPAGKTPDQAVSQDNDPEESSGNSTTSKTNWYDLASDEPCAMVAFVWQDSKREIGLPYTHFTEWLRTDLDVVFRFGEVEARVKFSKKFPLRDMLIQFRFQRVAAIYAIPHHVKLDLVRIDKETGAPIPI